MKAAEVSRLMDHAAKLLDDARAGADNLYRAQIAAMANAAATLRLVAVFVAEDPDPPDAPPRARRAS